MFIVKMEIKKLILTKRSFILAYAKYLEKLLLQAMLLVDNKIGERNDRKVVHQGGFDMHNFRCLIHHYLTEYVVNFLADKINENFPHSESWIILNFFFMVDEAKYFVAEWSFFMCEKAVQRNVMSHPITSTLFW